MKRFIQVLAVVFVLTLGIGGLSQPAAVKGSPLKDDGPTETVIPARWRNLRPTESFLRDISMLPSSFIVDCSSVHKDQRSQGWIVGDDGVILSYCNDIWDQSITTESIPTNLYGVAAVTPTLAFATGVDGAILKYGWDSVAQDYTWVKLPIQVSNQVLYRIAVVSNGSNSYTAWAVGGKDTIYNKATLIRGNIYPNGTDPLGHPIYSATWTNVTGIYSNLPAVDLYFGVQALSVNDVWAVGGKSTQGVAIHWNGSTWTPYTLGDNAFYGVHFRSANDGWAVGEGGRISHYNGSMWTAVSSPIATALIDVSFSPDGTGWASGYNGVLLRYTNGLWEKFTDLRTDFWDYYALDYTSGHGWMVGQNPYKIPNVKIGTSPGIGGQILEFSDSDRAWVAVTIPTDNQLNDVITLSDTEAWAVGAADSRGATIIRWDGKHWQRWYQSDSPLPQGDLQTIDMLTPTNGWAAGSPPVPGAPAVMLHWDGRRWAPPRSNSPLNAKINSIRMITVTDNGPKDFGWAIAESGNAVAKYNYDYDYWDAVHTHGGLYYTLRGLSLAGSGLPTEITAWAVGRNTDLDYEEWFLKYQEIGSTWYWKPDQNPSYCPPVPLPNPPPPDDGASNTNLFGIRVMQDPDRTEWGFASGDYKGRATIYKYDGEYWDLIYCQPANQSNPSRFYATDIVPESGIGWFGGYYTDVDGRKKVFIAYYDQLGFGWSGNPYPINGRNIYDRPISGIDMSSDTMGWAVGEKEDPKKVGILYQNPYPNFTLVATPDVQAIRPGGHADYTISVNSIAAGNMSANLSIYGLPPGITPQISTSPINSTTPATVTLNVPLGYPTGKYTVYIGGSSTIHSGDYDIPVVRYTNITLWVTDHPITGVTPERGPSGTVVTITGENLGTDPGPGNRSTEANHVILAGEPMPDAYILSWSPTQIRVQVPNDVTLFPDGPVKDYVEVIANSTSSSDNHDFQLESWIESVDTTDDGNTITISLHGTSFGQDPGIYLRNTDFEHVTLDGVTIDYWNVISWSNNLIEFQVPSTTSLNGKLLTITSNGYISNTIMLQGLGGSNVFLPIVIR